MEPTDGKIQPITRQQLEKALAEAQQYPEETQWTIYRYLKANYAKLGSIETRTLLAAYIKLHQRRPSLINSCMLGLALKIAEAYPDFRLPQFLQVWGYEDCLREEDRQPSTAKDGRRYLSLGERVERARASYLLHHPQEPRDNSAAIAHMFAVKVFEKERQGRKRRFVKLVASDGLSMIADSHQFPCKPWEIVGRMFDVLTRVSKQGNERAVETVASAKTVSEVFAVETGYVDGIDMQHGHIHVFDIQSRHFVADRTALQLKGVEKGCFVRFCPIIAQDDPFKCAAIVEVLPKEIGREAFGIYDANVSFVNRAERYWKYALTSHIPSVSTLSISSSTVDSVPNQLTGQGEFQSVTTTTKADVTIATEGFAKLDLLPESRRETLASGQHIRLILFLKRGKDGVKRNYVAEAF